MSKNILYLGSQSQPRQELLRLAGIDFKLLTHQSSECVFEPSGDFEKYVIAIACDKMQHLQFPDVASVCEDKIFVLTADTLIKTCKTNQILGKPKDIDDAKIMLKSLQNQPIAVFTGCCLQVMKKCAREWNIEQKECWATGATVEFFVDDNSINLYLQREPRALHACGGGIIEGVGQAFLKSVNGSYTTVLGLPLFELRQMLSLVGFEF